MTQLSGNIILTFDLWCTYNTVHPVYRVYVDDYLMTERTYIWQNPRYFLKETVPLYLPAGLHYLRIENLNPSTSAFSIQNVQINGKPVMYRPDTGKFTVEPSDLK